MKTPRRPEFRDPRSRPSPEGLAAILRRCGTPLDESRVRTLWDYHGRLRAANADLNLTRIHQFENMVLKHYVDSLLVLKYVDPLPTPLIDMGSGPGLPGIPLKIARPATSMILAEPRSARVRFLEETVAGLGLRDVEAYPHKITPRTELKAAGVITRAVASIGETLDRVAGCLDPGGAMIFMKGPGCDAEIAEARTTHAASFRLMADHAYAIPGTTHDRRLVIYERLAGAVQVAPGWDREETTEVSARDIISAANPTYRLAHDLLTGAGIRKQGRALMAGPRLIGEVLRKFPERAIAWFSGPDGPPPSPIEGRDPLDWYRLERALFETLDVSGTHSPLLMVSLPSMPAWSDADPWPDGCTLFVPFQDPENVGAVIRSATAFGVPRVVLLKEAAHPFHPKAVRAAGPALFQVALQTGPSLTDLRSSQTPLIALSTDGPDLEAEPFPTRFGLVVGLEGPGLPPELRSGPRRRIPITPGVESLNAAVSAAVALYAWSRQATTNEARPTDPSTA